MGKEGSVLKLLLSGSEVSERWGDPSGFELLNAYHDGLTPIHNGSKLFPFNCASCTHALPSGLPDPSACQVPIGTKNHRNKECGYSALDDDTLIERLKGLFFYPSDVERTEQRLEIKPLTTARIPRNAQELVAQMRSDDPDVGDVDILQALLKRWPDMYKYKLGAYIMGVDPNDPDRRKAAEKCYQKCKNELEGKSR